MLWWLLRAGALYATSFIGCFLVYYLIYASIVPPVHVEIPLHFFPDGNSLTERIQLGSSMPAGSALSSFLNEQAKKLLHSKSSSQSATLKSPFWRAEHLYDISLLLEYADRPEVADLGGIKFEGRLLVAGSSSKEDVLEMRRWQALKYEVPLHRLARQVIELPLALWYGRGSTTVERIFLARGQPASKQYTHVHVSIGSLQVPLRRAVVEITGHLQGLAYLLYYWRVAGFVVIVGGGVFVSWMIISVVLAAELIVKGVKKLKVAEMDDSSIEGSVISLQEFEGLEPEDDEDEDEEEVDKPQDEFLEEVEMIISEEMKEDFIDGLRRRRVDAGHNEGEKEDQEDDQSVPNTP